MALFESYRPFEVETSTLPPIEEGPNLERDSSLEVLEDVFRLVHEVNGCPDTDISAKRRFIESQLRTCERILDVVTSVDDKSMIEATDEDPIAQRAWFAVQVYPYSREWIGQAAILAMLDLQPQLEPQASEIDAGTNGTEREVFDFEDGIEPKSSRSPEMVAQAAELARRLIRTRRMPRVEIPDDGDSRAPVHRTGVSISLQNIAETTRPLPERALYVLGTRTMTDVEALLHVRRNTETLLTQAEQANA